ncbi:hypothetical protein CMQ_7273 [Grosmannia clavigera kw1407]|uniref:Glycoside hydrolase family 39 n=1 Tax=Grosmannia clavigera (strain kw1407 / UAMH 11150) TaxID=655863 RepID=F0XQE6_GROCL|nr:uncharacterized protein CMQ_7273 [Grosmannia clavigera kw1407]EFX00271.1 hypothetical protein CMQ_7273 [Grosmannia clavigera kw1407]
MSATSRLVGQFGNMSKATDEAGLGHVHNLLDGDVANASTSAGPQNKLQHVESAVLEHCAGTAAAVLPGTLERRTTVSGTAVVDLGVSTGAPQQLASGVLYGIPDEASQIPDHFYTDIGFKYCRAGGAQLPGQGWSESEAAYETRFQSALSNYQTTRKYGGTFILLPHDIWGADGTQDSSFVYPGDDGDWSSYDQFLARLISDLRANDMLDGLVIDIWNEPDLTGFWNRSQAQYLDLWGRASTAFRAGLPSCTISGPSFAGSPSTTNSWWTAWTAFVASNGSAPGQYSWHMEGGGGDMQSSVAAYKSLLVGQGLATDRTVNINEYAVWGEEVAAGSAWWIAQLERVNAYGLRGNWLSAYALHDLLASLVSKPGAGTSGYSYTQTGYYPTAQWLVYRYYAQDMGQGSRRQTTPTDDLLGDVFAVVGEDHTVRILIGARVASGTFNVEIRNLSAIGLATAGSLRVHAIGFTSSTDHYAELDAPADLGYVSHSYSGDSLTLPVFQTDDNTAYAYEFNTTA